jgi:Holliday junction resolvasome RuvABC endonuclease subunit
MKSILALDVSKNGCGWAFGLPGDKPISGVVKLAKDGDTDDEVFRNGIVWLTQQMNALSPAIVAIEAPFKSSGSGNTNPASQAMLLGLQGALRGVVKIKLPGRALLVASSSARKTFTGRGTYGTGEAKPAVQQEVLRRGWLSVEDMQPDRADALCLWCHVAADQLPSLKHGKPAKPSNVVHLIPPSERAF